MRAEITSALQASSTALCHFNLLSSWWRSASLYRRDRMVSERAFDTAPDGMTRFMCLPHTSIARLPFVFREAQRFSTN